jgi:thiamine pyrophosphate-dependent acetolactate synthase large subunit-like protein
MLVPTGDGAAVIRDADLILSLDWIDLAGSLKSIFGADAPQAPVIQVSIDHHVHNGWSMDHQGLPPVDLMLAAHPDAVVPHLLAALHDARSGDTLPAPPAWSAQPTRDGRIAVEHLASALKDAVGDKPVSLTHLPLSWNGAWWPFRHPLDYLGSDGGGGLAAGPGVTVGAALALKDSGRLPIGVCGDGDFMMGVTALWTAAHYGLPLLIVVANNCSFFNDEVHQERVARMRSRPVENRWIGQRISDPDIDIAAMARAQGAVGFGPVEHADELPKVFADAIAALEAGQVVVVDVRVEPGYTPAMTAALTQASERK